jgi:hypothetical protein
MPEDRRVHAVDDAFGAPGVAGKNQIDPGEDRYPAPSVKRRGRELEEVLDSMGTSFASALRIASQFPFLELIEATGGAGARSRAAAVVCR